MIRATIAAPAMNVEMPTEWIDTVAGELDTTDREFAAVILRTWLQMLRNRLTAGVAGAFAAQLPDAVRAVFEAGWDATAEPPKRDAGSYTIRFARAARMAVQDVPAAASAATAAVMRLLPPVEVYKALDELSVPVRLVLNPGVVLTAAG